MAKKYSINHNGSRKHNLSTSKCLSLKKETSVISYGKITKSLNTIYRSEIEDINRFVSFIEKAKSY